MARVSKQSEALKKHKESKHRNRVNALLWAKLRWLNGVERQDIVEGLIERYGYSPSTALNYADKAHVLAEAGFVNDAEKIICKNLQRLNAIAEAASDSDDYANAIKAIDTLNKMSGAYVDKKEISIESNNFTIKIDGE